jgi:hypothetical protein
MPTILRQLKGRKEFSMMSTESLGEKPIFHLGHNILTHNFAIERSLEKYYNKKIFFVQTLLLHFKIFSKHLYWNVSQKNIFNSHRKKILDKKYFLNYLIFYRNTVRENVVCDTGLSITLKNKVSKILKTRQIKKHAIWIYKIQCIDLILIDC